MNTLLHNEEQGTPNMMFKEWRVNSIIVSAQFWPQFKTETLELPENIAKGLEAYTKAFEAVKGNRTLVWKPHLGSTNIDLEIGDKKINLTVSPIHAAIIYQFQVKVILKLITFKQMLCKYSKVSNKRGLNMQVGKICQFLEILKT